MKFTITREALLKPLQLVAGVVERRQTLPVLSNVLMEVQGDQLSLTGTDLEVEMVGHAQLLEAGVDGEITVPAKKLMDICKSLPDQSTVEISLDDHRVQLQAGRSKFVLSSLPANEFPNIDDIEAQATIVIPQAQLRRVIDRTAFAMAQQDVRYYLNGMLWEVTQNQLRAVATDGHRLALCDASCEVSVSEAKVTAILPRKGIIELSRLLADDDVRVSIGSNHIRVTGADYCFTSKLVDGAYPDYDRVVPKGGDKLVVGDREQLKQAFGRTAILSNEKYRGVRIELVNGAMHLVANNPEQEEAQEEVTVAYSGESLEIGFNVSYLLDVLNVLKSSEIRFTLADSNSSALVEDASGESKATYVVMPMRL